VNNDIETFPGSGEYAPKELVQKIQSKAEIKPEKKHNWLYSVVPLFPIYTLLDSSSGGIYLAGYCKDCRTAFTVRLPEQATPMEITLTSRLDIPVFGCLPVDGA